MDVKKNKNKDVRNRRGLFFQIGMICSIGLSILAFSWQNSLGEDILPLADKEEETILLVPNTDQKEELETKSEELKAPEPPKNPNKVVIAPDTVRVATGLKPDTATPIIRIGGGPIKEIIKEPKVFTVVEKMPVFPGGMAALDKFVYSNFQYPGEAREVGVHGRVFIEFIVNEHGKMTDIKIATDHIGFGCAEEALRVINQAAHKYTWTPGEQLNTKVRVKYRYPIIIKLH